jgi:hypothetical protein
MSLRTFTPPSAEIMHGDKPAFTVRGLSLADLSHLMRTHMPDIQVIVGMWQDFQAAGPSGDIYLVLTTLAADAPILAAHIIACCAGDPDAHEQAKQLPIPLQIEALTQIFRLTFEEYGGLEKTVAALAKMAAGFGVTLPRAPQNLQAKPVEA